MPKPTPSELQQAKLRKAQETAAAEQEAAQERERLVHMHERYDQLNSVVSGLYDEVDTLARKWPAMEVSELAVQRTNRAIRAVKDLLIDEGDEFVAEMEEIVPGG